LIKLKGMSASYRLPVRPFFPKRCGEGKRKKVERGLKKDRERMTHKRGKEGHFKKQKKEGDQEGLWTGGGRSRIKSERVAARLITLNQDREEKKKKQNGGKEDKRQNTYCLFKRSGTGGQSTRTKLRKGGGRGKDGGNSQ